MAVIFELVVSFPWQADAAVEAAKAHVAAVGGVRVQGTHVPFGEPFVSQLTRTATPYIEFSVHPGGIGYGSARPGPVEVTSLNNDDLNQIGNDLYDVLRGRHGYLAGVVGWDPESLVDIDDLHADWLAGDAPDYDGLVLREDICARWGLDETWQKFANGYRWLPYQGSRKPW